MDHFSESQTKVPRSVFIWKYGGLARIAHSAHLLQKFFIEIAIFKMMVLRDTSAYSSENSSAYQPFPVVSLFLWLGPSFIGAVIHRNKRSIATPQCFCGCDQQLQLIIFCSHLFGGFSKYPVKNGHRLGSESVVSLKRKHTRWTKFSTKTWKFTRKQEEKTGYLVQTLVDFLLH